MHYHITMNTRDIFIESNQLTINLYVLYFWRLRPLLGKRLLIPMRCIKFTAVSPLSPYPPWVSLLEGLRYIVCIPSWAIRKETSWFTAPNGNLISAWYLPPNVLGEKLMQWNLFDWSYSPESYTGTSGTPKYSSGTVLSHPKNPCDESSSREAHEGLQGLPVSECASRKTSHRGSWGM